MRSASRSMASCWSSVASASLRLWAFHCRILITAFCCFCRRPRLLGRLCLRVCLRGAFLKNFVILGWALGGLVFPGGGMRCLGVGLLLWGYLGVVWWVLGLLGVVCVCIGVHFVDVVLWLSMCLFVLSLVRCMFSVLLVVLVFSALFVVGFRWCGCLVLGVSGAGWVVSLCLAAWGCCVWSSSVPDMLVCLVELGLVMLAAFLLLLVLFFCVVSGLFFWVFFDVIGGLYLGLFVPFCCLWGGLGGWVVLVVVW